MMSFVKYQNYLIQVLIQKSTKLFLDPPKTPPSSLFIIPSDITLTSFVNAFPISIIDNTITKKVMIQMLEYL